MEMALEIMWGNPIFLYTWVGGISDKCGNILHLGYKGRKKLVPIIGSLRQVKVIQ
jgi:hypothetical protein